MAEPVIRIDNLVFEYPGKRALNGVSVDIAPDTITALVGPNGAGKTTLLRCVAALARSYGGAITVDGVDVSDDPRECHRRIGYLSDFFGLYEDLTARQCLTYRAAAQRVAPENIDQAVALAAERLRIGALLDQKAGALSRGQRQGLAIAQALVHEPRILLLDEPASGLDPDARLSLSKLLVELRGNGITLVVSSHILSELEDYSTDVLMIDDGRVVDHRRLDARDAATTVVRIELAAPDARLPGVLAAFDGASDVSVDSTTATVSIAPDAETRGRLLRHLLDANMPVCAFAEDRASMHDLYLARMRRNGGEGGGR